MRNQEMVFRWSSSIALPFLTAAMMLAGCGSPNRSNIQLRKQIQTLQDQVNTLTLKNAASQNMIQGLQASRPTIPTLPPDELKKLFVAYGIKFARLTGGADLDPDKPGDEGIKAYVSPMDENGTVIQAAGSFVVEAFDLALQGDNRIGRWEFSTPADKSMWHSLLLEASYELTCPWQKIPVHRYLTLKVTFTDELTHASFAVEKGIEVNLPPAGRAATQPR